MMVRDECTRGAYAESCQGVAGAQCIPELSLLLTGTMISVFLKGVLPVPSGPGLHAEKPMA